MLIEKNYERTIKKVKYKDLSETDKRIINKYYETSFLHFFYNFYSQQTIAKTRINKIIIKPKLYLFPLYFIVSFLKITFFSILFWFGAIFLISIKEGTEQKGFFSQEDY